MCFKANAGRNKPERYYQEGHCNSLNGSVEYVILKQRRVDCLTEKYAIEYDFANKIYECLSQARYYGKITGKIPVCALIMEDKMRDKRFLDIGTNQNGVEVICIGKKGMEIKCPHA
jgi:hypothetical protein